MLFNGLACIALRRIRIALIYDNEGLEYESDSSI